MDFLKDLIELDERYLIRQTWMESIEMDTPRRKYQLKNQEWTKREPAKEIEVLDDSDDDLMLLKENVKSKEVNEIEELIDEVNKELLEYIDSGMIAYLDT